MKRVDSATSCMYQYIRFSQELVETIFIHSLYHTSYWLIFPGVSTMSATIAILSLYLKE
jgi:hypothetical protein